MGEWGASGLPAEFFPLPPPTSCLPCFLEGLLQCGSPRAQLMVWALSPEQADSQTCIRECWPAQRPCSWGQEGQLTEESCWSKQGRDGAPASSQKDRKHATGKHTLTQEKIKLAIRRQGKDGKVEGGRMDSGGTPALRSCLHFIPGFPAERTQARRPLQACTR